MTERISVCRGCHERELRHIGAAPHPCGGEYGADEFGCRRFAGTTAVECGGLLNNKQGENNDRTHR